MGALEGGPGEAVFDACGGELLPGLHDHHIHLLALARQRDSIDLGGQDSLASLAAENTAGSGWLRGVNYHETTHGNLDRWRLDACVADRPLRVQHASGKLWVLNTLALELIEAAAMDAPGIERNARGELTGRLFRMDGWLRNVVTDDPPDLDALGQALAAVGITSVTDASYTNTPPTIEMLNARLPQQVYGMGDATLSRGWRKVMLDDDRLPDFENLCDDIRRAHAENRGVGFHCVSHVELVFALAALDAAGTHPRDRIEHAGVVRDEVVPQLKRSGCTVVTQPGFLVERGDRYLAQAEAKDRDHLYPYASLLAAGIPVAASSDAPYGPYDPWQVIAAAVTRRTVGGAIVGADERVSADEALRGYLASPLEAGGPARTLSVGMPADLVLLRKPWSETAPAPETAVVQATFIDGELIYSSSAST